MFRLLFLTLTLSVLFLSTGNAVKVCIHCKHFAKFNIFMGNEFGRCKKFPKFDENHVDYLVTGKKKDAIEDYYYCSTIRMNANKCGVLGISYEPKK